MNFLNKRSWVSLLLASFFFLNLNILYAQNQMLSLKDALSSAEKNYPLIKASVNYVKSADYLIKEARREYIPSLRLSEQMTYATANSLPGTYFSYGVSVSGSIEKQNQDNPNFGAISALYSEFPVFTFGENRAKIDLAKTRKNLAESGLAEDKFQVSARTAEAYFDLIALINLRRAAAQNLQRASDIRNIIRSSTLSGLTPGVDSSTANAEVSKARLALIDAINNEVMERNYLEELTGLPLNNINPDTTIISRLPQQQLPQQPVISNPIINVYKQKENLSIAQESLVRKNYLPRISILGAAWGRGSGISPESQSTIDPTFADGTRLTRFNYAIGVGAVFNILDYPRMEAEANSIKYQSLGLQEETNEQQLILQKQLKDAEDNFDAANKKAKESPVMVSAARSAYQQKLAMYKAGLINFTDLAQSLYNLNEAETQNAISFNNAWKALLYEALPTGDLNILMKQL